MKTSCTWYLRSIMGKVMLGLVLAAMISSIDAAPVFARDGYRRPELRQYENRGRGYDRGYDRGRYMRYRGVYRPYYGYDERVYVPPPVYYDPDPTPGIRIFLPPLIINP